MSLPHLLKDFEEMHVSCNTVQADASVLNLGASVSAAAGAASNTVMEDLRRSVGPAAVGGGVRPSGLARPGFGIKAPSGIARSNPAPGKSRMMSNIERMGGGSGSRREES